MNALFTALPLLCGFALDALVGDPYWLPHPIRAVGRLISRLEKLARSGGSLALNGVLLAVSVVLITTSAALAVLIVGYRVNLWLGFALESVMCCYLIAARCLCSESAKVRRALERGDVEGARKAVSMIVGRDTAVLDEKGIARAAVETVAENTSDGVTAPIMYIGLFGAAGGFFYKAVNTMDSMIGYTNERYRELGRFAAKLDDAMNFIPSRLTAVIMIVSAFILRLDGRGAYRVWRRDRRRHASPNSAQTEAACAGALGLRLAGDAYYFGELHKKEFIGDPVREIEPRDIKRADRLMYLTSILTALIFFGIRILIMAVIFNAFG